jgi:hypothetical protein
MSASPHPAQPKETIFLYDLSPELEAELLRRAAAAGRDASTEAAEIIERHLQESSTD